MNEFPVELSAHSGVDIDDVVLCMIHDGMSQLTNAGSRSGGFVNGVRKLFSCCRDSPCKQVKVGTGRETDRFYQNECKDQTRVVLVSGLLVGRVERKG